MAQGKQILDLLSGATTEQAQQLIQNGDLLKCMVEADLSRVDRDAFAALLAPATPAMFRSVSEVYQAFVERAQARNWFSSQQLNELAECVEEHINTNFKSTLSGAFSFDIWLGDLQKTFEELWLWAADEQTRLGHNHWRYDGLKSGKEELRLLHPKRYGNKPSVTPVILDLTANRGKSPRDVRDPVTSAGVEVLATAALHPQWVASIDYDRIPAVWLSGLEATTPGSGPWRFVPRLARHLGDVRLYLSVDWYGRGFPSYALPERREL
jgi:hypothetical protein